MKLSRNQISGAVIVLLGVFVFIMISRFSIPISAEYPGPRALPGLAAIGFIICGSGIFLEGCKNKDREPFMTREGYIRLALNIVLLMLYVLAMKYVGYIISTPIMLFILSSWYAEGHASSLRGRVIFSLTATAVIYLAYSTAFGYSLPMGILFE